MRSLATIGFNAHLENETTTLATKLLHLEDRESESAVLHSVKVGETKCPCDKDITPYSIEFRDLDQYEATMEYWTSRVMVIHLFIRLKACLGENYHSDLAMKSSEELRNEQLRLVQNIFMGWESDCLRGPCIARSRPMVSKALATWAVVSGSPCFRGKPADVIREAILRKFHAGAGERPALDLAKMDETAEMYTGGPLKGFTIALYRDRRYTTG